MLAFAIAGVIVSLFLFTASIVHWSERDKPVIVVSPDGLLVRRYIDCVIPWVGIRAVEAIPASAFAAARLKVIFNDDLVRGYARYGNKGKVSKTRLRTTLRLDEYAVDPAVLERSLREGVATASAMPPGRQLIVVQERGNPYVAAAFGTVILTVVLVFVFHGVQRLRDDPLRMKIAAPNYKWREEAAEADIKLYPRDTRVRIVYANHLANEGHLAEAETELRDALADSDALRAISSIADKGRHRTTLREYTEMSYASVLWREGKDPEVKDELAGLCRGASFQMLHILMHLDLCHYE